MNDKRTEPAIERRQPARGDSQRGGYQRDGGRDLDDRGFRSDRLGGDARAGNAFREEGRSVIREHPRSQNRSRSRERDRDNGRSNRDWDHDRGRGRIPDRNLPGPPPRYEPRAGEDRRRESAPPPRQSGNWPAQAGRQPILSRKWGHDGFEELQTMPEAQHSRLDPQSRPSRPDVKGDDRWAMSTPADREQRERARKERLERVLGESVGTRR